MTPHLSTVNHRSKRPAGADGMGEPPSGGTACRDTLKSAHYVLSTVNQRYRHKARKPQNPANQGVL